VHFEPSRHATAQGGFVQRRAHSLPPPQAHVGDSAGLPAHSPRQDAPAWQLTLQVASLQVKAHFASEQKQSVHSASQVEPLPHEVSHCAPSGQVKPQPQPAGQMQNGSFASRHGASQQPPSPQVEQSVPQPPPTPAPVEALASAQAPPVPPVPPMPPEDEVVATAPPAPPAPPALEEVGGRVPVSSSAQLHAVESVAKDTKSAA
jgi:hypothetical protein